MKLNRASGVLLHPTSLPGPYGIGELGQQAFQWVDFLAQAGCGLWQILPLGPTGYGDSPYQSFSAFAGNPYLISLEQLAQEGLLQPQDLDSSPPFPQDKVEFGSLIAWKLQVLEAAFLRFLDQPAKGLAAELETFRAENEAWLREFCLFMALKETYNGQAWSDWPGPVRQRLPEALQAARRDLADTIRRHEFLQFMFARQWKAVRDYAAGRGVRLIGDIPIFVAYDSADVWANPELFFLDSIGRPTVVAGVPPDYFSETGQLWGNPIYRWEVHKASGYEWWLGRFRAVLGQVDCVRLDHFRGFAGYWEVPAGEETAVRGRWVPGPGAEFLRAVQDSLEELPIIAEDLGEITPDVVALRDEFDLPGMKILVFAFDSGPENDFLPHHYQRNCVVYTGTHDNDTAVGWYQRVKEPERKFFHRYLRTDGQEVSWTLIQAAWASVADYALAPMQDVLGLGNEARMNYPGRLGGNWTWRMPPEVPLKPLQERLLEVNSLYSRISSKTSRT